jgi:hypothetical protein
MSPLLVTVTVLGAAALVYFTISKRRFDRRR